MMMEKKKACSQVKKGIYQAVNERGMEEEKKSKKQQKIFFFFFFWERFWIYIPPPPSHQRLKQKGTPCQTPSPSPHPRPSSENWASKWICPLLP
jgi:hypothetical protein